jgi:hypothetical protein
LTSDGALKSITAKNTNVTGTLNLTGSVGTLALGQATGATITIGGAATDKPVGVTLVTATDTSITSLAPLKSVTAGSFTATSSPGTITAPVIGTVVSKGDFTQDVSSSGAVKSITIGGDLTGNIFVDSIGSLTVKGSSTSAQLRASRAFSATEKPIGKVTIGGQISGTLVLAQGNIGTVTAAAASSGSAVYAGMSQSFVQSGLGTLPATAADFANPASIASVTIKASTASTWIAASKLGKVSLGVVTLANNATPFGVASDMIASVSGSTAAGGPRLTLKKLDTQDDVTEQTNGADLQDFQVVLV